MFNILTNIVISAVTVLVTSVGVYNYLPLKYFDYLDFGKPKIRTFGATITTIAATDTIRDSRAVINDNFTSLNNGKIEYSTTSVQAITTLSNLVTVGTLTSGSLGSGFTTVVVARGGTGSTTLSANQILLGNGTTQLGVVNGFGTSGQYLQSQGVGTAPQWITSSINEAAEYNWTARHTFGTATTSFKSQTTFDDRFYATSTEPSEIRNLQADYATSTIINVTNIASTSKMVISNECMGCFKYTGSSTALTLTTGTNDMAGIPALANFGIASWTITDSSNAACVNKGTLFIAREGVTAATAQAMDGSGDGSCDGGYSFTFTGSTNTFSVGEIVDTTADSSLAGTIYWYR